MMKECLAMERPMTGLRLLVPVGFGEEVGA